MQNGSDEERINKPFRSTHTALTRRSASGVGAGMIVLDLTPKNARAAYSGIVSTIGQVGAVLALVVIGYVVSGTGSFGSGFAFMGTVPAEAAPCDDLPHALGSLPEAEATLSALPAWEGAPPPASVAARPQTPVATGVPWTARRSKPCVRP